MGIPKHEVDYLTYSCSVTVDEVFSPQEVVSLGVQIWWLRDVPEHFQGVAPLNVWSELSPGLAMALVSPAVQHQQTFTESSEGIQSSRFSH